MGHGRRGERLASKTSISANFANDSTEAEFDVETFSTGNTILQLPLIESKGMGNFPDSRDASRSESMLNYIAWRCNFKEWTRSRNDKHSSKNLI